MNLVDHRVRGIRAGDSVRDETGNPSQNGAVASTMDRVTGLDETPYQVFVAFACSAAEHGAAGVFGEAGDYRACAARSSLRLRGV